MEKLDLKNTKWICLHDGDFKKREVVFCILESRGFKIGRQCRRIPDCNVLYGHGSIPEGWVYPLRDEPGGRYSIFVIYNKITYDDIINTYKEEE